MRPLLNCLIGMTFLVVSSSLMAQGMRVSTNVYDTLNPGPNGQLNLVSRSLSLFHNGRVYDSVDLAEEVVILDINEKKFTVLNTKRSIATTLSFEEMRRMLEVRVPAVEKYIQEVVESNPRSGPEIAESLRFQLHPHFDTEFDATTGLLVLKSASFTYRAETRPWEDGSQIEKYLTYADWTCRLNHLMHPKSMFPEPRLELNTAMRELKNRMPISVELDLSPNDRLRLRAEHQFTVSLDNDDRTRIAAWDAALQNKEVRMLPFRNYQQTTLVSHRK
jgi:hypothetical protein